MFQNTVFAKKQARNGLGKIVVKNAGKPVVAASVATLSSSTALPIDTRQP
ncbi:hypothetical protein [uncultured Bartonella sp.]|nr:hypothetical protein [uncultured Bartonella sp.]